jgi:hypothetical protein
MRKALKIVGIVVAAGAVVIGLSAFTIKPWADRWGATDEEVSRVYPGDEFIKSPTAKTVRAITINAPVEKVWPWINQMGQERGGLYSYEGFENLIGSDLHNADIIHPEWQMKVGDSFKLAKSVPNVYTVAIDEPNKMLVLRGGVEGEGETHTWGFYLEPINDNTTRLVVKNVANVPDAVAKALYVVIDPGSFVMERGTLYGIKERAERAIH